MSFHDIILILVNQIPCWKFPTLSTVDRTCWQLLGERWKRELNVAWSGTLDPLSLWVVQTALSSREDWTDIGRLVYNRHVVTQCDVLVHPHFNPMEITEITITSSAPCRVQFYFWEYPMSLQVDGSVYLEFPRTVHSTYKLGNVLCMIEAEDCDVVLTLRLRDNLKSFTQLWYHTCCLEDIAGKYLSRNMKFWGGQSNFPCKQIQN